MGIRFTNKEIRNLTNACTQTVILFLTVKFFYSRTQTAIRFFTRLGTTVKFRISLLRNE